MDIRNMITLEDQLNILREVDTGNATSVLFDFLLSALLISRAPRLACGVQSHHGMCNAMISMFFGSLP
jgi:hypothetical protein